MTRRDDPALYRAAEKLLAAVQMVGDDGASHATWRRRALRLIREAMLEQRQTVWCSCGDGISTDGALCHNCAMDTESEAERLRAKLRAAK